MSCRCSDLGLDQLFDAAFADQDARRYLKRGLPVRAQRLLELIAQVRPIAGVTSIEGGSGAGALTVELARRGARRATGIDAMPPAVARADQLALETGVHTHVTFQIADFADLPAGLTADLVILDRVVCCYPDWTSLLGNAARASNGLIALSYPVDTWWARIAVRLNNFFHKLMGRRFRLQLHEPAALHGFLQQQHFALHSRSRYWLWELALFTR